MDMMRQTMLVLGLAGSAALAACGKEPEARATEKAPETGEVFVARDSLVDAILTASGVAEPLQQATLSTRLMGTVTGVTVREGERVAKGQVLARIDASEIDAKRGQVTAGVQGAEAMYQDARTQAERIRGLYRDSAATRAQLDAVEAGLARAEAGLAQAKAAARELEAVGGYAAVEAPFAGIVTRRYVDPGAFAAPGAPLVAVQDASQLRIRATVSPDAAQSVKRGDRLEATVEGRAVVATVEGVVPAAAGSVYTLNALVDNRDGRFLGGSAATLRVPAGRRHAVLVPASAIVREGDLTGVRVKQGSTSDLRWVRLGDDRGDLVEVLSGLSDGDQVVLRVTEGNR
jgi:RND family efflux transporter MFP subunit